MKALKIIGIIIIWIVGCILLTLPIMIGMPEELCGQLGFAWGLVLFWICVEKDIIKV